MPRAPRAGLTPEERAVEFLSPGEVGHLLGVSPKTVVLWAKEGRIPYTQTLGGHHRFRRSDIDPLIPSPIREDTTTDD